MLAHVRGRDPKDITSEHIPLSIRPLCPLWRGSGRVCVLAHVRGRDPEDITSNNIPLSIR